MLICDDEIIIIVYDRLLRHKSQREHTHIRQYERIEHNVQYKLYKT